MHAAHTPVFKLLDGDFEAFRPAARHIALMSEINSLTPISPQHGFMTRTFLLSNTDASDVCAIKITYLLTYDCEQSNEVACIDVCRKSYFVTSRK